MEPTCLFCLEPIKDNLVQNPIGCSCKILVHPQCFQQWCHQKQQLECPVCHTVVQTNPHIVYVIAPAPEVPSDFMNTIRRHDKCLGFCCCGLLLWFVALSILSYAFEK